MRPTQPHLECRSLALAAVSGQINYAISALRLIGMAALIAWMLVVRVDDLVKDGAKAPPPSAVFDP
jgi:hypothetical protein